MTDQLTDELIEAAVAADREAVDFYHFTSLLMRTLDEQGRSLADYRAEELARMRLNFYGFDPSYHIARYNFIRKIPKSRTPLTLAHHRSLHSATGATNSAQP